MTALLAGRGKLVVLYDRDGIVYRNERLARDFKLASRVEFETPAAGAFENVQGLCAKVRLLGCVRVRSLVKVGKTLEVHAGTFTSETPLKPIQAREGRSGHAPDDARRTAPAPPRRARLMRCACHWPSAVSRSRWRSAGSCACAGDGSRSGARRGLAWEHGLRGYDAGQLARLCLVLGYI